MAKESQTVTVSSIGCMTLLHLLTIAFVVMKLAEIGAVKDWSWFYVLLPSIIAMIPLGIVLLVLLVVAVIFLLAFIANRNRRR